VKIGISTQRRVARPDTLREVTQFQGRVQPSRAGRKYALLVSLGCGQGELLNHNGRTRDCWAHSAPPARGPVQHHRHSGQIRCQAEQQVESSNSSQARLFLHIESSITHVCDQPSESVLIIVIYRCYIGRLYICIRTYIWLGHGSQGEFGC